MPHRDAKPLVHFPTCPCATRTPLSTFRHAPVRRAGPCPFSDMPLSDAKPLIWFRARLIPSQDHTTNSGSNAMCGILKEIRQAPAPRRPVLVWLLEAVPTSVTRSAGRRPFHVQETRLGRTGGFGVGGHHTERTIHGDARAIARDCAIRQMQVNVARAELLR